jgi:hypothetical protein
MHARGGGSDRRALETCLADLEGHVEISAGRTRDQGVSHGAFAYCMSRDGHRGMVPAEAAAASDAYAANWTDAERSMLGFRADVGIQHGSSVANTMQFPEAGWSIAL